MKRDIKKQRAIKLMLTGSIEEYILFLKNMTVVHA